MVEKKNDTDQIKEFILLCLKNWYYFVISFLICGVLGIIYLKTATPIWRISSQVSLRQDESLMGGAGISRAQSLMSSFGLGSSGGESIEDETLKLKSQGYLKKVVKNLNLNTTYTQVNRRFSKTKLFYNSPITLETNPALADTLSVLIRFSLEINSDKTTVTMMAGKESAGEYNIETYPTTIKTDWGEYTFNKSPHYDSYKYPMKLNVQYSSYDFMAQVYQQKIFADYVRRTSVLMNLGFESENTYFGKNILNEVIKVYNQEWIEDKELVSTETVNYIDKRLISTMNLLSDADSNIQQFKDKYNLTDLTADVAYYLKATGELQIQALQAETQLNIADIIMNFVKDNNNKYSPIPYDVTIVEGNIAQVIAKYNEELLRRNELYNADTQSAMARSLDKNIEIQRENLLITLKNIQEGLLITLENIKKKEKEFISKVGNVPSIEKEYISLKREQEIQQEIYLLLLQMREQSALKGVNILPKLRIINAPYVLNKKASPKKLNVALVIFITGTGLSLSLMYGIPYLRFRKKKRE